MSIPDLIQRLETAEGGSRELDAAIYVAMPLPHYQSNARQAKSVGCVTVDYLSTDCRHTHGTFKAPSYTGSIDAAIALAKRVLPDAYIELSGPRKYLHIPSPVPNHWKADVDGKTGWGPTPALSLCLAILRAIESQSQP